MSDAKLDLILDKLSALEQDVGTLKQDVGTLKQDVGTLKQDVGTLKEWQGRADQRQQETIVAFKQNWSDMADLYRRVREDVKHFEDRLEGKLTQVNQSIQALRDTLERQDFRADELGRRVTRLEEQPRDL